MIYRLFLVLALLAAAARCGSCSTCRTAYTLLQHCASPASRTDGQPRAGCCPLIAAFHLRGCLDTVARPQGAQQAQSLSALSLACTQSYPALSSLSDAANRLSTALPEHQEEEEDEAATAHALFDLAADASIDAAVDTRLGLRQEVLKWLDDMDALQQDTRRASNMANAASAGGLTETRNPAALSRPGREDVRDVFELADALAQLHGGVMEAPLLESMGVIKNGKKAHVQPLAGSGRHGASAAGSSSHRQGDRPVRLRIYMWTDGQPLREGPPPPCRCAEPPPPLYGGAPFLVALTHRFATSKAVLCQLACCHPKLVAAVILAQVGVAMAAAAALLAAHGRSSEEQQFISDGGGCGKVSIADASDPEWAEPLLGEEERLQLEDRA